MARLWMFSESSLSYELCHLWVISGWYRSDLSVISGSGWSLSHIHTLSYIISTGLPGFPLTFPLSLTLLWWHLLWLFLLIIFCQGDLFWRWDHQWKAPFPDAQVGRWWGRRQKTLGRFSLSPHLHSNKSYKNCVVSDWPDVDFQSKFLAFYQYAKTFNSDTFDYEELNRTDYVFMRWKEHFLVPDHTIKVWVVSEKIFPRCGLFPNILTEPIQFRQKTIVVEVFHTPP